MNEWVRNAVSIIEADFNRSADTHLIKLELPSMPDIQIYLKDESTHPTGSLKHRLARSLFLYGLCNGWVTEGTPIIESSSGSTAVSEAYFARLLGLPFIAVVPQATSKEKLDQIKFYGGDCHLVPAAEIYAESERLAQEKGGHYMDQFTYAERVTDWRGNNNIAESIFAQMAAEPFPEPEWVVVSAGTGGTSATIGRYIRYRQFKTKLCVPDPENSVFYDFFSDGDCQRTMAKPSNVEGIGRPRVEPSFMPSVIEKMIKVPDAASYATIHFLENLLNRKCGGSTGTNLYATLQLAAGLQAEGKSCSLVTMICDDGARYLKTYYDEDWLTERGFNLAPYMRQLDELFETGKMEPSKG
ncbi:MAG: PLP-dependent cysteine synthase family protein [Hyphomicrobiales bacterium]